MTASESRSVAPEACCTLCITGEKEKRPVRLFKAIGSPNRFQIMEHLVTHSGCIAGDIVDVLPIAQATVSQHSKVLSEVGSVISVPERSATCYELDEATVSSFREKVGEVFRVFLVTLIVIIR